MQPRLILSAILPSLLLAWSATAGATIYSPPDASLAVVKDIDFKGPPIDPRFRARFLECENQGTCDGKPLKYTCRTDRNRNSVLRKLKGQAIFFDAKMGLDADGSPYSKRTPGQTDQPQTSLRYKAGGESINADRVPFIVIPLGGFDVATGVKLGDIAAVVNGSHLEFAIVADKGPICRIGEGSIALHESLGHKVCVSRSATGDCEKLRNVSIPGNVLYFVFPGTHQAVLPGMTPENINERIKSMGQAAWLKLKAREQ